MSAYVEAVPPVVDGPREAADLVVGLENSSGDSEAGQLIRRRQSSRPGTNGKNTSNHSILV